MYESSLMGVEDVKEFLTLANEENYKIISMVFISTTEQVLVVTERQKPIKPFVKKAEPEPEEEE